MAEPAELDRRARRKLELRGRMLEAAVALFDECGVQATKVADICARADVAQKTFFNHFASKQQLLRALAEEASQQLLVEIEAARKGGKSTRQRLERFFGGVAERAALASPTQRELLTELIHAIHESGTEPDQARRLHAAFGALVEDGLAAGDTTGRHPPETLTEMIMGAYYALMFNWANLDSYPIHERARAAARFLADALTMEDRDGTT
jgi:TetR/AcrR family transcriptional regulator, regulator of autoinduction and epiphytic fitness